MNYINFLISYKKPLIYWGLIFIIVCLFPFFTYLIRGVMNVFTWIIPVIIFLSYFGYYTLSYYNYCYYAKIVDLLKKNKVAFNQGICQIEIHQDDFSIKPIKQNYDAIIKIAPSVVLAKFIKTEDILVLSFSIDELGIFKKFVFPLIIVIGSGFPSYVNLIKGSKRISEKPIQKGDIYELSFSKSIDGIHKIIIIDYPN
jgi:hypothetical protein